MEQGLFCLRSASAFLLLQQGERALTGVLLEPTTLRCRGVVRCVEAVPCRGLQGLRSPSLFLEVVAGVMGRWLRMAREALSTQDREGKISLLLRNGSKKTERCGGDLVKVLWGVEEEVELAMAAIVREKAGDCNGLNKEQAVALVLGKQDALNALVAASVKRLPLLSPSNPHHDQIRTVFRSLLLTLAYHTNSLSLFPIPSPAHSVPSPANPLPRLPNLYRPDQDGRAAFDTPQLLQTAARPHVGIRSAVRQQPGQQRVRGAAGITLARGVLQRRFARRR